MSFDKVKQNLEKKGYKVTVCDTKEDAAEYIDKLLDGKSVGFGGSVTVEQMGLYDKLKSHNEVYSHAKVPEGKTKAEIRTLANAAEVYISSANGLSEEGEIVNIDGACNRISSICYGHEKVIFVIGKNKLASTYDEALFRARNIAAPKNAQRLKKNTPCAVKADKCYNCNSPDRICRVLSVFWSKPMLGEFEVVLINENLGF